MRRWVMLMALCASSTQVFAQDEMPTAEREAYLEACLIVTQDNPDMAGYRQIGTGTVTRGHATVSLFDTQSQLVKVACSFVPLAGAIPQAQQIIVTHKDGTSEELDLDMANGLIEAGMN